MRNLGAKIGDNTRFIGSISHFSAEPYLVQIGENCLISDNVYFHTHDGGVKVLNGMGLFGEQAMDKAARIKVGNNCFIGSGARIMGGVRIGDNCIVGAARIVTKDVPDGSVVAGMPARVICTIEDYYERNRNRGFFYPTARMNYQEKKAYLTRNVPEL